MGRQNIVQQEERKQSPMLPIIGFAVFLIVGGVAFLVSPAVVKWLSTTTFKLGGFIPVLPISFPQGWPPIANQLAVTLFLFIVLFALSMAILFFFMKVPGQNETDVNLDDIRREKQKKMKRH